jgi:hypothetical protein
MMKIFVAMVIVIMAKPTTTQSCFDYYLLTFFKSFYPDKGSHNFFHCYNMSFQQNDGDDMGRYIGFGVVVECGFDQGSCLHHLTNLKECAIVENPISHFTFFFYEDSFHPTIG